MTTTNNVAGGGRYALQQLVIEGPATELWRADLVCAAGLRRPVAFKRLRAQYAQEPEYRESMTREARMLLLLDHPNVAQLLDFGEDDAGPYVVTEWAWGLTLFDIAQLSEAHHRRPSAVVLGAVGVQILYAFDAAHRRMARSAAGGLAPAPILQRDLSPSGVLLTVRGTVKLTDFGLPRPFTPAALELLGADDPRVSYVAPELADGGRPSVSTDVYACGALLWEAITGRRMWAGIGPTQALALLKNGHRAPRVRDIRPDVHPAIAGVIDCALAPSPTERYDSATGFARALEDALRTVPERTDPARLAWEVSTALQLRQRMMESVRPASPPMSLRPNFRDEDEGQVTQRLLAIPSVPTALAPEPRQSLIPVEFGDPVSIEPPDESVSSPGPRMRRDSAEMVIIAAGKTEKKIDAEILDSDKPPRPDGQS